MVVFRGDQVLIDDGRVRLRVTAVSDTDVDITGDLHALPEGTLVLYPDWEQNLPAARAHLADADVAMVTSYQPDGVADVVQPGEDGQRDGVPQPDRDMALDCGLACDFLTIQIAESRIDLAIGAPEGIVALRTIESAFDSEGAERRIQAEVLARELRITLGQLPVEIREGVRQLNIFGEHRFAEQLLSDFQTRARVMGLEAVYPKRRTTRRNWCSGTAPRRPSRSRSTASSCTRRRTATVR